jgi:ABC-type glycerol-3-phosphate transport system permease component
MHRSLAERLLGIAIVVFATVLTLYPIAWMLAASLKTNSELFSDSIFELGSAGFSNFTSSLSQRPFFLYLFSSQATASPNSDSASPARSPSSCSPRS